MKNQTVILNGNDLSLRISNLIIDENYKISLNRNSVSKIKRSRNLIDKWIKNEEAIYGITTGFGEFKDIKITTKEIENLQKNLILSHSAGTGKFLPDSIVRLMLLYRINSLIKGYSGVRLELIVFMIDFFNSGLIPLIPSQGSVGSSGDLAPLAHLALAFIGEGYCKLNNKIYNSDKALKISGLKPVVLKAKEGLALINGTQMMCAYLSRSLLEAERLVKVADITGSMSLDALRGTIKAFDKRLHNLRPHKGQMKSAENLWNLLKDSEIYKSHLNCGKIQDAYSLRCMPQVHGAVRDTIEYCKKVLEVEINSVTDNPIIIEEDNDHIEGGNFHGEPLAFASDFLKIAISELGNISERRVARLIDGSISGLPRFLTVNGGLNSGFMIAQYTAASLVSENKVLSFPASVDSIPTSANQEDHNSLGSISSRHCFEVCINTSKIFAIELLCASQGLDFLRPMKSGRGTEAAYNFIRKRIKHSEKDELMSRLISEAAGIVSSNELIETVEKELNYIL